LSDTELLKTDLSVLCRLVVNSLLLSNPELLKTDLSVLCRLVVNSLLLSDPELLKTDLSVPGGAVLILLTEKHT
jgi:hypothetical protein